MFPIGVWTREAVTPPHGVERQRGRCLEQVCAAFSAFWNLGQSAFKAFRTCLLFFRFSIQHTLFILLCMCPPLFLFFYPLLLSHLLTFLCRDVCASWASTVLCVR